MHFKRNCSKEREQLGGLHFKRNCSKERERLGGLHFKRNCSFFYILFHQIDVYIKENLDSAEQCLHILKVSPDVFETWFLEVLMSGGPSRARQDYLFKRIQPFAREGFKDELCPSVEE